MVPRRSTEDTPTLTTCKARHNHHRQAKSVHVPAPASDARIPRARRQCGSTSQCLLGESAMPPCGSTPRPWQTCRVSALSGWIT